jgi:hypothetical protein
MRAILLTFKPLYIMQTGMVQCSCAWVLIFCVLATSKQGKVCGAGALEMKNISYIMLQFCEWRKQSGS